MGATTASTIITSLREQTADSASTKVTDAQWIAWINDAEVAIIAVEPRAAVSSASFTCVTGSVQALPSNTIQLIDIPNNLASDGTTPGREVHRVSRNLLDSVSPGWRKPVNGSNEIREYIYDERNPKVFEVVPPVRAGQTPKLKVIRTLVPTALTVVGDTINVDDQYVPAIRFWALHNLYARPAESQVNFARSTEAFTRFFNVLNVMVQSEMAVSPKVKEHVK